MCRGRCSPTERWRAIRFLLGCRAEWSGPYGMKTPASSLARSWRWLVHSVWTSPDGMHWTERRRFEAVAAFALLTVCSGLVFTGRLAPAGLGFPFLVLPVLVWIAVRLGGRATLSATLLACAFATWGTLHGLGPFAELGTSLLLLQLFTSAAAITGLMLVAGVTERRQ